MGTYSGALTITREVCNLLGCGNSQDFAARKIMQNSRGLGEQVRTGPRTEPETADDCVRILLSYMPNTEQSVMRTVERCFNLEMKSPARVRGRHAARLETIPHNLAPLDKLHRARKKNGRLTLGDASATLVERATSDEMAKLFVNDNPDYFRASRLRSDADEAPLSLELVMRGNDLSATLRINCVDAVYIFKDTKPEAPSARIDARAETTWRVTEEVFLLLGQARRPRDRTRIDDTLPFAEQILAAEKRNLDGAA